MTLQQFFSGMSSLTFYRGLKLHLISPEKKRRKEKQKDIQRRKNLRSHIPGPCRARNGGGRVLVQPFSILPQKKSLEKNIVRGHCIPPAVGELKKPSPQWLTVAKWSLLLQRSVSSPCSFWSWNLGAPLPSTLGHTRPTKWGT